MRPGSPDKDGRRLSLSRPLALMEPTASTRTASTRLSCVLLPQQQCARARACVPCSSPGVGARWSSAPCGLIKCPLWVDQVFLG